MNEIVDDYATILFRVAATIPRTFQVRKGDKIDSELETLELSATDYKDISTGIMIQLSKEAKALELISEGQLKWINDVKDAPDRFGEIVRSELKTMKKKPEQLTKGEASTILDKLKAARAR